MENPFSFSFGTTPSELIERPLQTEGILESFLAERPPQRTFMITGVWGSGKTTLMTDIASRLKKRENWTVIALSPESDMIHSLAAKLSNVRKYVELFRDAKINLSLFGLALEIDGEPPVTDDETAIMRMLQSIQRQHGRVLLTVDEATNNENIKKFAAVYQILLRENLPLFLVMTGLYENIYDLQNEKSLTFLYRAPKIQLKPLNLTAVAETYKDTLQIDRSRAVEMARLTKGYAFAFQVLGYFTFREERHDYSKVMAKFRLYLHECVYEKLWSELSGNDRRVVIGMAEADSESVADICAHIGMANNEFSKYRLRLIRKGVADGSVRGRLTFPLPLFKEFILDQLEFL